MSNVRKINQLKAENYDENNVEDIYVSEDDVYEEETYIVNDNDDNIEIKEEYEDSEVKYSKSNDNLFMKIFNIFFVIAIISMIIITIDVICVARYNNGPYFAIKTNTYKDGGTKVYYGIGYKVIKYNQLEGRRDMQIGFWNMPYSTIATKVEDIDLAIEFQNDPIKTSEKYYKQYIQISSTVKQVDKELNRITLEYTDPDGKYTLQIECPMASEKEKLTNINEQQKISLKGTVYQFALKSKTKPNTISLADCFLE